MRTGPKFVGALWVWNGIGIAGFSSRRCLDLQSLPMIQIRKRDDIFMTHALTNATTISADGTLIGYRKLGNGTPVVILHGSISTGDDWVPVAAQLAEHHTVYVVDRRGRGLSGDHPNYALGNEADDIKAVLAVAGKGTAVIGHSFGAICVLEAVRTGAEVSSIVLYEPPLPVDGPTAGPALVDYAAAIESGEGDAAMRIATKHFLRISAEETEAVAASPLWPAMVELAPTWTRELAEIDATDALIAGYGAISVPALLLVGSESPSHLVGASEYLDQHLPDSRTIVCAGQGHFAHIMDPQAVAHAILEFLA
jgi:pimeloyl-ACP methyl ester carboxylesterase